MSNVWDKFPVKRGRFNGKPKAHWEREAKKLVIETLVRGSMCDTRSAIGALASERLLELAKAEDPELFEEVVQEREACQAGFARVMGEMLG